MKLDHMQLIAKAGIAFKTGEYMEEIKFDYI